jgi:uncharacterized membrane protein
MTDIRAIAPQHGVRRPGGGRRRLRRAERYLQRNLVWNRVYRVTSYARSALWIVPFVAIVLVLAVAPALRMLDAIVLAVDLETLLFEAEKSDGIIGLIPQVGDFLAYEEPLFALYGGAGLVDDRGLRATVAFGSERTMEQDPLFAFRILGDIGLKALSPAINDPTAVLALDQIHRLLKAVVKRDLQRECIRDDTGRLRVLFRTPNWEDYVHVACHEIRTCGAANVQIARRMRAMLDNVAAALPLHRHPALDRERGLLDRALETHFTYPEDLALARVPDTQGLGGSSATRSAGRV